jgi:hypothetical protein
VRKLIILIVLLGTSGIIYSFPGGMSGAFLNYGLSPRSLALGKTFTGLANDAEAGYYNPAGLAQINVQDIKLAHSFLYDGTRMEYIGYALPTRFYGTFGVTLINFGVDEFESRDQANNRFDPTFASENAYLFSYAYRISRFIGLGSNLKIVTKNISVFSDVSFGGDLGAIFFGPGNASFGAFIQNILPPKLTLVQEEEQFPLVLRIGGALRLYKERVIILADLLTTERLWKDQTSFDMKQLYPHLGIEFELLPQILTQRIGIDRNELSFGIGLRREWGKLALSVDYALLLHHESAFRLPLTNKLGLSIKFAGFRTWIDASQKLFVPKPGDTRNVLWMDLRIIARRPIKRWQILVKNHLGEIVRTFSGWDKPPSRIAWDGLDDVGRLVADGKYFYEIIVIDEQNEPIQFSGPLTLIKSKGPQGEIKVRTPEQP